MQTSRSPSRSRSIEAAALSFALLLLCCSGSVGAQTGTNNSSLSFGSFTAGSGGAVTVNALGARSSTLGVILSSQGAPASAAQFTILGSNSAIVTISLPADGTALLSDGANTMAMTGFVSNPPISGVLSGGGTLTISIGAVLNVGIAQPPGNYTGSFQVTVNY